MTECITYAGRIWLEVYRPGEGVEIFAFKNMKQVELCARGLILLLCASALAGGDRYSFLQTPTEDASVLAVAL
jgi:hypothetical protein